MGKKVMVREASSSSSMKVSKNNERQLHGLIKVLKPKVYITDASSFKRIVQELTGNVTSVPSSANLPSLLPDGRILTGCQEMASEGPVQARAPIPPDVDDQDCHVDSRSMSLEVRAPAIEPSRMMSDIDHQVRLEELESWLLEDMDHQAVPFWESSYHYDQHQEVGIYDYGFSGMW